tara:strand:- start:123 stop:785 length:663 start_codon:yes stop_codon:yes gene_type:complete
MSAVNEFRQAAKEKRLKHYITARTVGYCARRLYFDLIYAHQVPPSPSLRRLWKRGSQAEVIAVEELTKAGTPVTDQQRMLTNADAKVRGKIDGAFGSSLFEIKSAASQKFDRLYASLDMSEYLDQTLFYLHQGGYDEAVLVIIDRDAAIDRNERRLFNVRVAPNRPRYEYLMSRATDIRWSAEKDAIPPAEGEPYCDYECSFCPFQTPCSLVGVKRTMEA